VQGDPKPCEDAPARGARERTRLRA
jgi:hypothetical protein